MNVPEVKKILIVGDWMIDEHWVTGVHRSPMSSRTGKTHLRCRNMDDGATLDLCGAGTTAAVIHRAQQKETMNHHISGLGIWHEKDTDFLKNLIHSPRHGNLQPPHRFTTISPEDGKEKTTEPSPEKTIELANIAEAIFPDPVKREELKIGTTRIARVYRHTRSKAEILQRIDWETRIPNGKNFWTDTKGTKSAKTVSETICDWLEEKQLSFKFSEFNVIVVKAWAKGLFRKSYSKR